jgi:molybdopterin molybdotransferase
VLFLSGGVSAGDYDFVGPALEAEGVSRVFHKVHMKPGKPLWYGRRDQQHVFGLPGNPSSSVVTARLFAAPLLRALCGNARVLDPTLMLPLIEGFRGTRDRPTFQPAVIEWGTGVRLLSTHGSGDKRNFAGGTALAKLPANRDRFEAGDLIEVLLDEDTLRG